jgi:hypothetical protein
MPKPKATHPRNKHRGTKLTQLRLRDDTLADLARIEAHLSAAAQGARITRSEAVRVAIRRMAEEIRAAETL